MIRNLYFPTPIYILDIKDKSLNIELEMEKEENKVKLVQGQAVFFASFIRHRVAPVTSGVRKSLVMWFGGPPLR